MFSRRLNLLFNATVLVATLIAAASLTPSRANAINLGPKNYRVVQSDLEYSVVLGDKSVKVKLRKGQIVSLDQITPMNDASLTVERTVGGETVETTISIPKEEIARKFGPPLNPSNGLPDQFLAQRPFRNARGRFLRLDSSPYTLNSTSSYPGNSRMRYIPAAKMPTQTSKGGTKISVRKSKIVDTGNGKFTLVHNVCLEPSHLSQECGWVRNDFLSRGDTATGRYNWYTADASAVPVKADCERKDSLGQATLLGSFAKRMIVSLPATEQNAREKIRDEIGECVIPTVIPPATMSRLTKANENLYSGLIGWTASKAFSRVKAAAPKVTVRGPGGNRPMNHEDFMTIDALARTLFAEMRQNSCSKGPYLEATARVALNRAHAPFSDFRKNVGAAKSPILQALVSDRAFSVWNNNDEVGAKSRAEGRNEVKAAMCPSKLVGEQNAWERSLDLAMHAVLDENQFMRESQELDAKEPHYFYTSGITTYPGYVRQPAPQLLGSKLDRNPCMIFWKEAPKARTRK